MGQVYEHTTVHKFSNLNHSELQKTSQKSLLQANMFDTTKYYEAVKTMAAKEKKLQEEVRYDYSDDTEEVEKDEWY